MLETYDPDWQAKWDRAHATLRALETHEVNWHALTGEDRAHLDRVDKLRRLLPVIFDAKHRTANEYIRFHLSLTMQDAEREGLVIEHPWLPDDAGIDAARAAVAEVVELVENEKRRRLEREWRDVSGVEPSPAPLPVERPQAGWWAAWRARLRGK